MKNFEQIMKDFNKIATAIKETQETVNEKNFVCRLVVCYESKQREKNKKQNELTTKYEKAIDELNFTYKIRDNKYIYLLHKKEFNDEKQFQQMRELFEIEKENEKKILTINFKNIESSIALLDKILEILKENRKETTETETTKETTETTEKTEKTTETTESTKKAK